MLGSIYQGAICVHVIETQPFRSPFLGESRFSLLIVVAKNKKVEVAESAEFGWRTNRPGAEAGRNGMVILTVHFPLHQIAPRISECVGGGGQKSL